MEISLRQKKETALLSKNHEIGWDQFLIQKAQKKERHIDASNDILIEYSDKYIEIKNTLFSIIIHSKTGQIKSWKFKDKLITNYPLKPNFWRPPTDNDLGNGMDKWAKIWQDATYASEATLLNRPIKESSGVSFKVAYKLPNNEADISVTYNLYPNGLVNVDYSFETLKEFLPNIPRIGMYLTLPNIYKNVYWYGKGPEESYWDRNTGVKTGIYSDEIVNQFHRYSRPQETGNKTAVRFMELESKELVLRVHSNTSLLNTSVWPFEMKELDFISSDAGVSASGLVPVTKKHGADIKIGDNIQFNIDYLQMGVGGDTSWGRFVHDAYTIKPKKYSYSFSLQPRLNKKKIF